MDIEKANQIAVLVEKHKRYTKISNAMSSGYSDEWEFKNSHTGTTVGFTSDDWEKIMMMINAEIDEITTKLNKM